MYGFGRMPIAVSHERGPAAGAHSNGGRRIRASLGLVALALLLYLPGFWWGAPHATAPDRKQSWGVDDETPLGPLAELHNIIVPKPDRSLGYPLMHSFLVSAAYAPYLGIEWLTGGLTGVSETYPFGLTDPVRALKTLTYIAHLISVLLAVGVVLVTFDIGATLWGARTASLAALFTLVSFPMFYYSRTGNVDVPVLFFTALALAAFARGLVGGLTANRAAWLGVFAGFAIGTKESALAPLLAIPLVLLPIHARGLRSRSLSSLMAAPVAGLLAGALAFGMSSGLFVDPARYLAHLAFMRERLGALTSGDIPYVTVAPFTWEGHLQLVAMILRRLVDAMTLPGLLLAFLGVLLTLRREPLTATPALSVVTSMAALGWSARTVQLRYVIPIAFVLGLFAARAVVWVWAGRSPALKAVVSALVVGALGLNLLRGLDLTYLMINDSRYAAGAWFASQAREGDAVEFFGDSANLPPLGSKVISVRAAPYAGAVHPPPLEGEHARWTILNGWSQRKPRFIIVMPDLSSPPGAPHNVTCPPEIYAALLDGTIGYRLAAFLETPPLLAWVRRPALDYPSVNPPIRIFSRAGDRQ